MGNDDIEKGDNMPTDDRKHYKDEDIVKKLNDNSIEYKIFKDWIYGLSYAAMGGKYDRSPKAISKIVTMYRKKYDYIKEGKVPDDVEAIVKTSNTIMGRVKSEDIQLYHFYFSDKNLKKRGMSLLDMRILKLRYEDKLRIKDIANKVHRSESNIRNKLRTFNRVALASYWFTCKQNAKLR